MSDDKARRASVSVTFAGADITKDIKPYFMSLTYKDGEEDLADDLQLNLVDRDGIWLEDWLSDAVDAAAAGKLTISAVIAPENWGGGSLPTGDFELDSVTASGPGSTVSIGTAFVSVSFGWNKPHGHGYVPDTHGRFLFDIEKRHPAQGRMPFF